MRQILKGLSASLALLLTTAYACPVNSALDQDIQSLENHFNLPKHLLYALIQAESGFCVDAFSPKGAVGLGQLLPSTASEMGLNAYDPKDNIYGAAQYLRKQFDTFQKWPLALAAYNAGAGNIKKFGGIPPFKETQNYVAKILNTTQKLNDLDQKNVSTTLASLLPTQAPIPVQPQPAPKSAPTKQKIQIAALPIPKTHSKIPASLPSKAPISTTLTAQKAPKPTTIIFEPISTTVITPASTKTIDQKLASGTPHLTVIRKTKDPQVVINTKE